jgi:hypothetical protein
MTNCTRYLGLDVHAETISAAIAEGRGKIRSPVCWVHMAPRLPAEAAF